MSEPHSTDSSETLRDLYARHQRDPDDYETNHKLGMLLSGIRKFQIHAEPFLLRALSQGIKGHESVLMLDRLSQVLVTKGQFSEAEEVLSQLVALQPAIPEIRFRWGDALFRLGRLDECSQVYHDMISRMLEAARVSSQRRGEPIAHLLAPYRVIARFFGETAAKLDLYLKARGLGLIDDAQPVLLAPANAVANPALFGY